MKQQGIIAKGLIITIAIVAIIIFYLISSYNSLASINQNVNSTWAQVQNQYQRRMDLIPNLVNTVKGYVKHEKSTLTEVINARAKATQVAISPEIINDKTQFQKFQQTQGALSSTLSRLMVSVERYPELKANTQFAQLMDEIAGSENRIAVARRDFNNVVQEYNTKISLFPTNLLANTMNFRMKQYFEAEANASKAPQVRFD